MKIYLNGKEYVNNFSVGEKQMCLDVGGGWWAKEDFLSNNKLRVSFEELGLCIHANYYNDQNFSLKIMREYRENRFGIRVCCGNRRYKKFKTIPNIIGIVNYLDKVKWQLKALSFEEWESENFKFNRRLYKGDTKWVAGISVTDLKFMCLYESLNLEEFTQITLKAIETLQRLELMEKTRIHIKKNLGKRQVKNIENKNRSIKKEDLINLIFSEITDKSKIQDIIQGEDLNNPLTKVNKYKMQDIQKIYSWCKRNGFPREKLVYNTEVKFKYKYIDKKLVEFKKLYPQFNNSGVLLDFLFKRLFEGKKKSRYWRNEVISYLWGKSFPQRIKMYNNNNKKYLNQKQKNKWFYIDYDILEVK